MQDKDKIKALRFAIIGCGRIAPKHAESIAALPEAELAAVCDIIPEKARAFADKYGGKPYTDYLTMLREADIDVVTVATPSDLHARIGIAAAQAGKHVMVEKPMAMTLKSADELITACKEAGVKLAVIHQNRFNKSVKTMRRALEEGRFGQLTHGQATIRWNRNDEYYAQAPWRGTKLRDGGVLMNQSIHNIDLLQWTFGPVESVFGYTATRLRKIEMEDVAGAVIKFKNGAIGLIEAASTIYPRNIEETLNVFGETGSVIIGGIAVNRIETWEFPGGEKEKEELFASQESDPPTVYGFGHREIIQDMIRAVKEGGTPAVPGEEGRKALEIILAIYQCQETGQPVIFPLRESAAD
ncbi:Oxidoreductase family, NAD-binding Rossmann fold [Acididesulfobacillus acetoxydans]|uniref:Myo-inositol 2-dehydrogenase n=1 Tax=Acididesulfobacillus acetoxydans TaxID=1561005 RepID=A0A8S0XAA5_9FIRM|nr:Gfo/Idh/MocA family oxidoreductase [Acididesulfobacillus acetoxydans]CAA7599636.1 Oxidoreductase family, NAD-binding Rossmann fold [Acididesulfobacillus acetoxydans]CEJ06188.1 Myo-inositol 2-dehydrogenase [Acididesulfobacillus acetoxydans]